MGISGILPRVFGYDDATLERIRRRSPWTRVRIIGELAIFLILSLLTLLAWVGSTPAGMNAALALATRQGRAAIAVEDVELLPGGDWRRPETWRWALIGLEIRPKAHDRRLTRMGRVVLGLPAWRPLWEERRAVFGEVRIVGLEVERKEQSAPPEPEDPRKGALVWEAARLEIWDARYHAAPDPPFGEALVSQIYGEILNFRYEREGRKLSGEGSLRAQRFLTGAVDVTDLRLPKLQAVDSRIEMQDGSFRYGGSPASISGHIERAFQRAEIDFQVHLRRANLARVIAAATGRPSPLSGTLDFSFRVHSGGETIGGAWMEGRAVVRGGVLELGADVSTRTREILEIAPFLESDAEGNVVLGAIDGTLYIDRRQVILREMTYQAPRRTLQLRGKLSPKEQNLVLRVVPHREAATRPGLGVVMSREGSDSPRFRLATREELLPGAPAESPPQGPKLRLPKLSFPKLPRRKGVQKDQLEPSDSTVE